MSADLERLEAELLARVEDDYFAARSNGGVSVTVRWIARPETGP